jgi:hypothetical protein
LEIAKTAEKMAVLGMESRRRPYCANSKSLFAIQANGYAIGQMDRSIDLVGRMLKTMEANYVNGLVKKVDVRQAKSKSCKPYHAEKCHS